MQMFILYFQPVNFVVQKFNYLFSILKCWQEKLILRFLFTLIEWNKFWKKYANQSFHINFLFTRDWFQFFPISYRKYTIYIPVSLEKLYLVGGWVWNDGPNFVAKASEPLGNREDWVFLSWYRLWRCILRNALTPPLLYSLKPSSINVSPMKIVQKIIPAKKWTSYF